MDTNGVCIDRWYLMITDTFVFNVNCVDGFEWLFDCSKDLLNRQSLKTLVSSRVILYGIKKENTGLTLREE